MEKATNRGAQDKEVKAHLLGLWDERLTEENEALRTKNIYNNKVAFDNDGNPISSAEEFTSKVPTEPDFIKLYLNDVVVLKGIQAGYKDILFHILKLMKYDDYIITLNKFDKVRIQKALGLKNLQQVSNGIAKLKDAGIIFVVADENGKVERGTFEVNPYLFGKGKWIENYNNRDTNKLSVLYRKNNREIINVDALIEYIKNEKDTEKRQKAIDKLNEIRNIKEDNNDE
jgi:hypothetical protein